MSLFRSRKKNNLFTQTPVPTEPITKIYFARVSPEAIVPQGWNIISATMEMNGIDVVYTKTAWVRISSV